MNKNLHAPGISLAKNNARCLGKSVRGCILWKSLQIRSIHTLHVAGRVGIRYHLYVRKLLRTED